MRKDIIHSKLPDVFRFDDGTRVTDIKSWEKRRKEIIDTAVELEFGGMPPKPDKVILEPLFHYRHHGVYCAKVHVYVNEKEFSFTFTVYAPKKMQGKYPAIISGDHAFYWCLDQKVIDEANRRGFAVVKFNRNEFAHDIRKEEDPSSDPMSRNGGMYPLFPNLKFSAVSAWAWGYHRVIDALENLDFIDSDHICIAGHSRGGKTTLLAGATDERIFATNSNGSGCHGCGCYRFEQVEDENLFKFYKSERLDDLIHAVPFWFGEGMKKYVGSPSDIPHDHHYFKALIAPRGLFESNGYDDINANPRGSYLTHLAAKEVWKLYGREDNCATFYREGGHNHTFEDFCAFFDFIEFMMGKTSTFKTKTPYDDIEPLHDWTYPTK